MTTEIPAENPDEIIFPIVVCPLGPHDVLPGQVSEFDAEQGVAVLVVFCPLHQMVLSHVDKSLPIKEWLTVEELRARGYVWQPDEEHGEHGRSSSEPGDGGEAGD